MDSSPSSNDPPYQQTSYSKWLAYSPTLPHLAPTVAWGIIMDPGTLGLLAYATTPPAHPTGFHAPSTLESVSNATGPKTSWKLFERIIADPTTRLNPYQETCTPFGRQRSRTPYPPWEFNWQRNGSTFWTGCIGPHGTNSQPGIIKLLHCTYVLFPCNPNEQ
jgi:hypothetical protein